MSSTKQATDSELVTWNFIRNHYEDKRNSQNVPMALKYLIVQFSKRIIGCKMLNVKQDMEFFNLLLTKLPSIRRFKLLYRASDNAYSHEKFHELCDDKGPTICIIKSNWGNIFGGYTSKSWNAEGECGIVFNWKSDKDAFLFLIKSNDELIENQCPAIIDMISETGNKAICCYMDTGPLFGGGHEICVGGDCNETVDAMRKGGEETYSWPLNLSTYKSDLTDNLSGSKMRTDTDGSAYLFQVIDYEVFNVQ